MNADVVIVGSGIGGATLASGLAPSGVKIVILECGESIQDSPLNRNQKAIFQDECFKSEEQWYLPNGKSFRPGNYYNVGGNSKFYGAVLARYRLEDFSELQHFDGRSPAWPISYADLEPWYCKAEELYQVRGCHLEDPTEPYHDNTYPYKPVDDEPAIASIRQRLVAKGLQPYSLPLGIDVQQWLKKGQQPWDAHPNSNDGKMDAESTALANALSFPNVSLLTNATVSKISIAPDNKRVAAVEYQHDGCTSKIFPRYLALAAGAVRSAALLLQSANDRFPTGLANSSDQVGRNFMNHNCSAVVGISPSYKNTSVYQKTFGINDFYLSGGDHGYPLGNVQLLGRVSGTILKSAAPRLPSRAADWISKHSVDFYAMSEDLPNPASRVTVKNNLVYLDWKRSNWSAHKKLVKKTKRMLHSIGFPIVLARPFDRQTPSHQMGTARMGKNPATAVVDVNCRSYDHPNLFVVDASFLPTSAAVNPALTIAANALRVADHICKKELN